MYFKFENCCPTKDKRYNLSCFSPMFFNFNITKFAHNKNDPRPCLSFSRKWNNVLISLDQYIQFLLTKYSSYYIITVGLSVIVS